MCSASSRASTFVDDSNPGLYCSACVATYFLDDGSSSRVPAQYRFDYHWQALLNVSYEEYTAYADDNGHVNISELRGGRIRVLNQLHLAFTEFLPALAPSRGLRFNEAGVAMTSDLALHFDISPKFPEGLIPDFRLTLVRSPKGSGKTEWLGKLVTNYRAQNVSVLLIGHRRALISATSSRIGLTSYLGEAQDTQNAQDSGNEPRSLIPPTSHYAICVDKQLRAVQYTDYTAEKVRTLFRSVDELMDQWADPLKREAVVLALAERGIDFKALAEVSGQPDADPFDLLCHLAFNAPLRTRKERADRLRQSRADFFDQYGPRAREVLNGLLDKYTEFGPQQLVLPDVLLIQPFSTYGNVMEIAGLFGGASQLKFAIDNLQALLYAP